MKRACFRGNCDPMPGSEFSIGDLLHLRAVIGMVRRIMRRKFMNSRKLMIASGFIAALFAGSAMAGEAESFTKLDANGDGKISMEEAATDSKLTEAWSAVDANQDGQIERAEFSAFEEQTKAMSK